jgi:hypothetical protein
VFIPILFFINWLMFVGRDWKNAGLVLAKRRRQLLLLRIASVVVFLLMAMIPK